MIKQLYAGVAIFNRRIAYARSYIGSSPQQPPDPAVVAIAQQYVSPPANPYTHITDLKLKD
jgi:hypothetical protein